MIESSRLGGKPLSYRRYRGGCRGTGPFASRPVPGANYQEEQHQAAIEDGALYGALDQPVIVDYAGERADVDQPMQELPAFSAEAADPAGGGSEGQRNQKQE